MLTGKPQMSTVMPWNIDVIDNYNGCHYNIAHDTVF